MTKRLKVILSELAPCECLADVGCDHGYITKAAIESGIAKAAVISDISAPSLKKAETLLKDYLGKNVLPVVCDGLSESHAGCDQILIAGMGGEEICEILLKAPFLPGRLVLQPMKNADKVRKTTLMLGYRIEKDYCFKDGKFYFLLVLEKGKDFYTEDEIFFGRDNLKDPSPDFKEFALAEYKKYSDVIARGDLSESSREAVEKILKKYGEILN